ncbi:MAG: ribokinase [Promethearchaeota archaeon]
MSNIDNYVLVVGSSNMDLNIYIERFPNPGETITGGTFKQFLGGKGANQSVASVRAGAKTIFIGKIGMDSFGDKMISQLSSEGVIMDHVIRDPREHSGVAFILIDKNGENMISVAPGANAKLMPEEIEKKHDLIEKASVILVQMEIPVNTIETIFKIASSGKSIKILNPAPLKQLPKKLFQMIDILIPNEGELHELNSLYGFKLKTDEKEKKLIEAAKNLSTLGINHVITTLGAKGALIYDKQRDEFIKIPSFKVKAVDTVGAGDCFNGVLACKLSQGINVVNAVKYAIAAASIAVTRKGAQASMPNSNEIEKKYEMFDEII